MADIRKRNSPKRSYQVRFHDSASSSGFGYRSFATRKDAKAFAARCEVSEPNHRSSTKRISVPEAVSKWLQICEKVGRDGRETVEPQTLVEYERRAKVICEYKWAKPVHELVPTDVIEFRTWLVENKSRDLARRCLSSYHSVLLEMKLQGYLSSDPAAGITIRANGRYEDNEVQIPTDAEMRDLYAAIDSLASSRHSQKRAAWQRFRPMFYLAGFSGMRPSEYRGLPWRDIGPHSVVVTQRADKTGRIGAVKSKAAKRTIVLPRIVSNMLEEWRVLTDGHGDRLVFGTQAGKSMLLANIFYRAWMPLMEEAGLVADVATASGSKRWPKYTMYCLRHYFASKLIERQQDFKYIQKVMGHSKIEITFDTYGHLIRGNEQAHKDAADDMAESVLNSCGESVATTC